MLVFFRTKKRVKTGKKLEGSWKESGKLYQIVFVLMDYSGFEVTIKLCFPDQV